MSAPENALATGAASTKAAAEPRRVEPRWSVRPYAPPSQVEPLMRALRVPPLLASVVWSRGLHRAPGGVAGALEPPLERAPIARLGLAAERIERALEDGERILLHGDYDADGISGTALLTLGLRALGGRVTPFIPDRLTDGYGVHPARVLEHAERADLFVTIDCGVSNVAEVATLRAAGVDVIVTDHHSRGETLPDGLLVHPRAEDRDLPLTGAGVAFHLLWAVHDRLDLPPPLEFADLATLGTVADVAPLLAENRALVREGLARMVDSRWPGVRAVVSQSRLRGEVSARDVAFVLAPRLNAAGRLGEADLGLELLTTASERRARELAAYLDTRNGDRRRIQDEMFAAARERVDPGAPAIVVGDDAWHPGVMGIVASKLLELHYKPVFIHARGKGSVRSTPGISAVGALRAAAPHLRRFGGHAEAAGFAIDGGALGAFTRAVHAFVAEHPEPVPTVVADALLSGAEISADLVRELAALEPFGEGHPELRFAVSERLEMARAVGRSRSTLQLRVAGVKGVAWRMGERAGTLPLGRPVDVALTLAENEWKGRRSVEFRAEALRPAAPLPLEPESGAAPGEAGLRVARGAPADPGSARRIASEAELATGSDPAGSDLWFTALPLSEVETEGAPCTTALLRATLAALAARGGALWLELSPAALAAAEAAALAHPSLQDVRRAFVSAQRGHGVPFDEPKARRVRRVLEELELVDALGRARRGQKRDPYDSPTLTAGLLERYRLQALVNAYRALDDDGFARAVRTLLLDVPAEDGSAAHPAAPGS